MLDALIEFIFPPQCACCDAPGTLLCESCLAGVHTIDPDGACRYCAAPGGVIACSECVGRAFAFSEARALGLFEGTLGRLITAYKDAPERRLAPVIAGLLAPLIKGGDEVALVPVPATRKAVSRRGFDHIAVLARHLAVLTGMPVERLLIAGAAKDQRSLGREERFANAEGRFALVRDPCRTRLVLLDDVLTTGATLDSAARVLRAGGATDVRALVVARVSDAVSMAHLTQDEPYGLPKTVGDPCLQRHGVLYSASLPPGSVVAGASAP